MTPPARLGNKNLYLYHPLVSEQDILLVESETFLTFFVLHFARREGLSKEDLDQLKRLLDKGKEVS